MILATPLAAAGFATAAVLTAVYCFRRRSPPKSVGSLLLWPKPSASLSAARRRDRLRTPPSFWLELFTLVALVCAALTPLTWRSSSGSLAVILDTSPSMSAGDAGKKAAEFLEREKKRGAKDAIRVRTAKDARALEREIARAHRPSTGKRIACRRNQVGGVRRPCVQLRHHGSAKTPPRPCARFRVHRSASFRRGTGFVRS